MRTIGRRLPPGLPLGDFAAHCDICGVPFYRSQLREDGAGRLVCPDEGPGLDEVTLAEMDAEALSRARRPRDKQSGRPLGNASELYENPLTIAGPANVRGWWAPERGLVGDASRASWRNEAPGDWGGNLTAAGSVPTVSRETGATFTASGGSGTGMLSLGGMLTLAGEELTIWVVATLGDEDGVLQPIFEIGCFDGVGVGDMLFGLSLRRSAIGINNGDLYGQVRFSAAGSAVTVRGDRPGDSSKPAIYKLTFDVDSGVQALSVNDATYTTSPPSGTGLAAPLPTARMGVVMNGTIHEAVATAGAGDVNSEMKAYFRRRWTDIPALGTETTEVGSTV